jgi:hypothetical protein
MTNDPDGDIGIVAPKSILLRLQQNSDGKPEPAYAFSWAHFADAEIWRAYQPAWKRRAGRRLGYEFNEPVCCDRVACASPATVLPLWKTAALAATGATAVARPKAATAARMMFFIEILHL